MSIHISASAMGMMSAGGAHVNQSLAFFWVPDAFEKLMNAILLPLKVTAFKFKEFIDPLKPILNSCNIDK